MYLYDRTQDGKPSAVAAVPRNDFADRSPISRFVNVGKRRPDESGFGYTFLTEI